MDARAIEFEENSFDVVIDKGTLDAVLVKLKLIIKSVGRVQPAM
jgi:hypothetical protein